MTQPSEQVALVITGMHRSGTSLVAGFIQALGVDIGSNLMGAFVINPKGFFEDIDFVNFQIALLQEYLECNTPGAPNFDSPEINWTHPDKLKLYQQQAQNLIQSRTPDSPVWGWKDPRTSLLLEFWYNLLPKSKYLLIYRYPWDTISSTKRVYNKVNALTNDQPQIEELDLYSYYTSAKTWCFYTRHILDFYQKHQENCILVNINAIQQNPILLTDLLIDKLGLNLTDQNRDSQKQKFDDLYDSNLFQSLDWQDQALELLRQRIPQCFYLLDRLDRIADIPSAYKSQSNLPQGMSNILQSYEIAIKTTQIESANPIEKDIHKISIISICHDNETCLKENIDQLQKIAGDISCEIYTINVSSQKDLNLESLNSLRIEILRNDVELNVNKLAKAKNACIAATSAEYILFLKASDIVNPGYISKAIAVLNSYPEVGVVYGSDLITSPTEIDNTDSEPKVWNLNNLLARNCVPTSAIFRKAMWTECQGYDESGELYGHEDWNLWLTAVEKGWKFQLIDEVMLTVDTAQKSGQIEQIYNPQLLSEVFTNILDRHLKLYLANVTAIQMENHLKYGFIGLQELETKFAYLGADRNSTKEKELEKIRQSWEEGDTNDAIAQLRKVLGQLSGLEIANTLVSLCNLSHNQQSLAILAENIEQYRRTPNCPALIHFLQEYRYQIAKQWLTIATPMLEAVYQNEDLFLQSYHLFLDNFREAPLTAQESVLFTEVKEEVAKGFAHTQALQNLLIGLMYAYPYQLSLRWERLRVPTWFLPQFTKLMLDQPATILADETDKYYQHLQKLTNLLHQNILRNTTSPVWQKVAQIFTQRANSLLSHLGVEDKQNLQQKIDEINNFAFSLAKS